MKVVCAWCQKTLKEGEISDSEVSHGICPDCLRRLAGGLEITLSEFLDKLEFPVLITNHDTVVLEANRQAANILGKPTE
jgi:PAS domain-containing protein